MIVDLSEEDQEEAMRNDDEQAALEEFKDKHRD